MHAHLTSILSFLLVLLLGVPSPVLAQEEGQEQDDPSQLPEIAPREIEIRGQLQIAFPSLQRQPLQGFSTSPQLPSVPDNRRPYVEPYKQELNDLPDSLPELEATPPSLEVAEATPARGLLETGSGRYFTRFAEGRLSVPLSPRETFSVHGAYTGTEGFTAFESPSVTTPSDEASAELTFESRREGFLIRGDVHGAADQYTLYGATPAPGTAVQGAPERDGYSVGSTVRFQTRGSVQSSLQASYTLSRYTTQFVAPDQGEAATFAESQFGAQGSLTVPIGPFPPRLDAEATHSRLSGDVPDDVSLQLDAGASIPFLSRPPFTVRGGVRLLTFQAPADPERPNTPTAEATFVSPSFQAKWNVTESAVLHLENTPRLQTGSLDALYEVNPYAEHAPSLQPTLETTNAEAKFVLSTGPVRLSTTAGYRYAPSYRYFESGGDPRYTQGIFQTGYESARIIHGGGQLALEGFDTVQLSLGASLRDGELTESETMIPNFAPLTANAMLSFSFADDRGLLQLNGNFESRRYPTRAQQQVLSPYVSFDVEGTFSVSSRFDVIARAQNLSVQSPEKWPRYPRPPAVLTAGLRIQW